MDPSEIDILQLIPQRPPMVMIDKLIYSDEKCARGKLFIKDSNIFCEKGHLQEAGLTEFIAQTAAAHTGYYQLVLKKDVSEGYIGAVKNLIIHNLPKVNTEINSEITIDSEVMGFTILFGKVFQENKLIAECEMRIIVSTNIGR